MRQMESSQMSPPFIVLLEVILGSSPGINLLGAVMAAASSPLPLSPSPHPRHWPGAGKVSFLWCCSVG